MVSNIAQSLCFLVDLSGSFITESGVLEFRTVTGLLPVFPSSSVNYFI